jgi:hypothetical protein
MKKVIVVCVLVFFGQFENVFAIPDTKEGKQTLKQKIVQGSSFKQEKHIDDSIEQKREEVEQINKTYFESKGKNVNNIRKTCPTGQGCYQ